MPTCQHFLIQWQYQGVKEKNHKFKFVFMESRMERVEPNRSKECWCQLVFFFLSPFSEWTDPLILMNHLSLKH
jgi:hypothetical protein